MRRVSDKEFAAVSALAGPDRYWHFLRHVADTEQVWSLQSADGWVLMSAADGPELVPVWSHPRYVEACAQDDWQHARAAAIPLDRWLEGWTPGMVRDGRQVAVFPTPGGKGVVVSPEQLRDELMAECSQYE
jgi:hypothetical protein